jgi:primosomal replication protein N
VDLNALALSGEITEIEELRHTPAGLPVVNFRLKHASWQIEAGHRRRVDCEVDAVAMGEAALTVSRMFPGSRLGVEGFIDRRSHRSAQLVLHVTKVNLSKEADHGDSRIEQDPR